MAGAAHEASSFDWEHGRVSAAWHRPPKASRATLLIAHGAGGTMHSPQVRQLAEGMAGRGITAVRFNFPYSEERRKAPDRQRTLEWCYRAVIEQTLLGAARVFAGGRSMGGRIASHVAASGVEVSGLVFFAYPLHPPGKPERLRDAHLADVAAPMLFLQGTRDAFARPDLLESTVARLPRATLHWIDGGDHGFRVPGRHPDDVLEEILSVAAGWIDAQP